MTSPFNQSIYDFMLQTLTQWGIPSLATDLKNFMMKGYTGDSLTLALQQTQAYKTRFAANEQRKANGLPELLPAQYIAAEESYQQVLQQYGLPKGFYDSKSDFDQFIANDVSPDELKTRAQTAADQWMNAPAETRQVWNSYYGLSDGSAIAAILNPDTPLSTLQNEAQTVGIGTAAVQNGLNLDLARAATLQQNGVTAAQAKKAYADISAGLTTQTAIANRFDAGPAQTQQETQTQMENASLLGTGQDQAKLQAQNAEEEGLFHGSSSMDNNALGVSQSY